MKVFRNIIKSSQKNHIITFSISLSELISTNIEALPVEKAQFILERIGFLRKLREKIVHHEDLANRLQLCDTAKDLPDWWIPIQHDRDLLLGAAKHGIARMEYFVLNDPDLCFKDILKRHLCGEPLQDKKALAEFEKIKNERVASKSSEETCETKSEDIKEKEKKGRKKTSNKKEPAIERIEEEVKETRSRRKSTKDSTDATRLAIEASKMAKAEAAAKHKKKDTDKDEPKTDDEKESDKGSTKSSKRKSIEKTEDKEKPEQDLDEVESEKPKEKEKRKISPFVEAPQISMQQMEQMAKGGLLYDMEMLNELMAQTYAAAICWPKDKILQVRLTHIVQCIESGEWPVPHDYPLGDHLGEEDPLGPPPAAENDAQNTPRDTPTPMSEISEMSFDENSRLKKSSRKVDNVNGEGSKSKIRSLLQQPTLSASAAMDASESAR
jgi:hypothetical protein